MMRGDVPVRIAYGAAWSLSVVYQELDGDPVDVTGYTAELRLSRYTYESAPHGVTVVSRTSAAGQVTVGTTNGTFTCVVPALVTSGLASTFGSPIPNQQGRYSLWVLPPGGVVGIDDFPLVHGWVEYRQVGEAVDPVSASVVENAFTTSVTAIGSRGIQGDTGPQGPAGTVAVDIATTVTSNTTETTIRSVTVPTGDWTLRVQSSVSDGSTTDVFERVWSGTNIAGVVSVTARSTVREPSSLLGEITDGTAANAVLVRAIPVGGSLTWKDWSRLEGT